VAAFEIAEAVKLEMASSDSCFVVAAAENAGKIEVWQEVAGAIVGIAAPVKFAEVAVITAEIDIVATEQRTEMAVETETEEGYEIVAVVVVFAAGP
jgi:hypothetical protein